jgi:hypothetical protein
VRIPIRTSARVPIDRASARPSDGRTQRTRPRAARSRRHSMGIRPQTRGSYVAGRHMVRVWSMYRTPVWGRSGGRLIAPSVPAFQPTSAPNPSLVYAAPPRAPPGHGRTAQAGLTDNECAAGASRSARTRARICRAPAWGKLSHWESGFGTPDSRVLAPRALARARARSGARLFCRGICQDPPSGRGFARTLLASGQDLARPSPPATGRAKKWSCGQKFARNSLRNED